MSDAATNEEVQTPEPQLADTASMTAVSQPAELEQHDTSWVPKRIGEITAARRAAEERAAQLEEQLAQLKAERDKQAESSPEPAQSHNGQTVDQLARAYAERLVKEQRENESFNQRIASINEAGAKEFGNDFEKSVQNLNMAGIGGQEFLKVLSNVDNAAKIVTYLGKPENINEAIRIGSLDPVQMGIEMMKLAPKASKALSKEVSRAPAPIEPVAGRSSANDGVEPDPSDTKAWIAWRAKQARKR